MMLRDITETATNNTKVHITHKDETGTATVYSGAVKELYKDSYYVLDTYGSKIVLSIGISLTGALQIAV